LGERRQMNAELEALQTSAALVWDLILGDASGSSSLVVFLAMVEEEVEKWVNAAVDIGVRWGTRFVLVAILSHFSELEPELELPGSVRDTYMTNGQVDALCPLVSVTSESLVLLIPSLLACDSLGVIE
jgi:hypothetical protein